jgi:hypothetical protein
MPAAALIGCAGPAREEVLVAEAAKVGAPWEQAAEADAAWPRLAELADELYKGEPRRRAAIEEWMASGEKGLDMGDPLAGLLRGDDAWKNMWSLRSLALSASQKAWKEPANSRIRQRLIVRTRAAWVRIAETGDLFSAGVARFEDARHLEKSVVEGAVTPELLAAWPDGIDDRRALSKTALRILNLVRSADELGGMDALLAVLRRERLDRTRTSELSLWELVEREAAPEPPMPEIDRVKSPVLTGWPRDPDARAAARSFMEFLIEVYSAPKGQEWSEIERLAERQESRPGPAAELIQTLAWQSAWLRDNRLRQASGVQEARMQVEDRVPASRPDGAP